MHNAYGRRWCNDVRLILQITLYSKLQQVYDVGAIKVKNVSNGTVGKSVTFLVETSQAGPGNYFIYFKLTF